MRPGEEPGRVAQCGAVMSQLHIICMPTLAHGGGDRRRQRAGANALNGAPKSELTASTMPPAYARSVTTSWSPSMASWYSLRLRRRHSSPSDATLPARTRRAGRPDRGDQPGVGVGGHEAYPDSWRATRSRKKGNHPAPSSVRVTLQIPRPLAVGQKVRRRLAGGA